MIARLAALSAIAAIAIASCKSTPASEVIVVLQTDLALPKDIDKVSIEVRSSGTLLLTKDYDVGPSGTRIPATLGVLANKDDPAAPVKIRVIGRRQGDPKLLRSATLTVPKERTALLRMPLQWLCWEQASEATPGDVESTCPQGQTCVSGACVDEAIDAAGLADFDPAQVFGGAASGGACFDTVGCMASGAFVAVQTSDCSIAKPSGGVGIDVAMVRATGLPGICSAQACFIPIDRDDVLGWKDAGDRIVLPRATCDRLALPPTDDQKILGIAVTTSCATKTAATPTCGPWSSVGDDAGTFDAQAPSGGGIDGG